MRAVKGVRDVEIDAVRMELVVSGDRGPLRMDEIIEAVRRAGFEATPK